MIIDIEDIQNILLAKKIKLNSCLHLGAFKNEDLSLYNKICIREEDVIHIDVHPKIVDIPKITSNLNIFNAFISDEDNKNIIFNNFNNLHYSNILDYDKNSIQYSQNVFNNKILQKSITIDTFFNKNNLDASKYDFWYFNIKGTELLALKGGINSIKYAKVLYLYINSGLIYEIDDFLVKYNFKRILTNMTPYKWGEAIYILNK
jgi:hypothetical protein